MKSPEILEQVEALSQEGLSEDHWKNLPSRKQAEIEFHNKDRDAKLTESLPSDTFELMHGNKKYYRTTQMSRQYVDEWIQQHAQGKVFLDYACGNGGNAILAAQAGAKLSVGLDISDVSIRNCREKAASLGLKNVKFLQGDCEATRLPDNSVDAIICSGMLHHLDLSYAFPELRRILKPGGKVLGVEALNYNPLIKIYRLMTPSMRTEWEKNHILSLKDIRFARRFFDVENIRYWHAVSYLGALLHKSPTAMQGAMGVLNRMDQVITRLPFLQLMSWQFTFELVKRDES